MSEFLIVESGGYIEPCLNESTATGRLKFRGKFQEANQVNKNKRMYPYEILASSVNRLDETVKSRSLVGELDHPDNSIIHFDKASHLVTKLWWEGNALMGEGEVLDTPHGRILKSLLEAGVRVGISSRGVGNGTTNNEGVLVIGESYKLITFDAVADPSTFQAFQKMVAGKKESVKEEPIISNTNGVNNNSLTKTESSSIYNVNANALIAYLGHLVEEEKQKIRNNI